MLSQRAKHLIRHGRRISPISDGICHTLNNILPRRRILQRQAAAPPALEPAEEGAHSRNPFALQKKRRPGAAGFIRSGAVENDIAISRDLTVPQFELGWQHPDRARQLCTVHFQRELAAKVEDHNILLGLYLPDQLIRRDARDAQFTEKAPALQVFPPHVPGQGHQRQDDRPVSQACQQ